MGQKNTPQYKNIIEQNITKQHMSAFHRADGSKRRTLHDNVAQHRTSTEQNKLPAWPGEGLKLFPAHYRTEYSTEQHITRQHSTEHFNLSPGYAQMQNRK